MRSAYLVEAVRVDGKPRQKTLAYLGCIRESQIDAHWHRVDFWTVADAKLAELELKRAEQRAVEKALAEVVGRPDKRSLAAIGRALKRLEGRKP